MSEAGLLTVAEAATPYDRDTIARLRAAGEQLAAALRIAAACHRCHGEGQVDYHPRGPNSGTTLRGECDRCRGRRCSIGAMAALEGWEEAEGSGR